MNYPRVGFTGTREGMTDLQHDLVADLLGRRLGEIWEFHHGDCVGADREAHDLAIELEIPVWIHPPKDPKLRAYCDGIGPGGAEGVAYVFPEASYARRNQRIVDKTDVLIATPKEMAWGSQGGTWMTVGMARKKQLVDRTFAIYIVYPDGSMGEEL